MRKVYVVLRNMLLFFFLVEVFAGALVVNRGTVIDKILVGIVFGIFMMLIPNILKFFKMPLNSGTLMLVGVIVSFMFFFVGIYVLQIITVAPKAVDLGIAFVQPIQLTDKTVALVFLSLVSAISSIGMEIISGKSK